MIHQLIFAGPKPGMTTEEFQDYWLNNHAVNFASKIPQIRKYKIDLRIPFDGDMGNPVLPHKGVAEIWLANDEESLASLQSREFLQGARLDEPNWAAFWLTFGLNTTAHSIIAGPESEKNPVGVKMFVLNKRKPGTDLEVFRKSALESLAAVTSRLPGIKGYMQCHTQDGHYVFGESTLDLAEMLWFDNTDTLKKALSSEEFGKVRESWAALVDPKYTFSLVTKENWVIGPESR